MRGSATGREYYFWTHFVWEYLKETLAISAQLS